MTENAWFHLLSLTALEGGTSPSPFQIHWTSNGNEWKGLVWDKPRAGVGVGASVNSGCVCRVERGGATCRQVRAGASTHPDTYYAYKHIWCCWFKQTCVGWKYVACYFPKTTGRIPESHLSLGKNKINVNGKGAMGVTWKSTRGDLEMREKQSTKQVLLKTIP